MSNAEPEPANKPASKPAEAEAKPAAKAETKPVGKVESRQAGKGSKRRPYNAQQFGANYGTIRWSKGQSQRPKH
jgi:hypothetical protein